MSNIDKQALRKLLDRVIANSGMTWYSEEQLGSEDCFDFPEVDAGLIAALGPKDVLALLDELEAKDKHIAELEAREVVLPQRYSMLHRVDFHEPYHTEMVYKQHQVLEALHDAGVNVAAAGKGE